MPLRLGRGPLGREDLWRLSVIPEARREPARENRVIMTRTGMEQAGLHQGPTSLSMSFPSLKHTHPGRACGWRGCAVRLKSQNCFPSPVIQRTDRLSAVAISGWQKVNYFPRRRANMHTLKLGPQSVPAELRRAHAPSAASRSGCIRLHTGSFMLI